jgi:hypothetical protein
MSDQSAARNEMNGASADVDLNADQAAAKEGKTQKAKLVRDSFTIPKAEYTTLNELRQRSTRLAQPAKKSEVLRAGIALLKSLSDQAFLDALAAVPNLKTGRPKKEGEEGDEPTVRTGRKIIDKIAKRPVRKAAAKAGEEGNTKPKTLAEKSARAVKRAEAGGAKTKAGKGAKAGNKAGKAGKAQRANRPVREEEEDEV